MTINKKSNGKELVIGIEGSLDTSTAPALEKELKENLKDYDSLVLDLENLDYISSAGLRVVLSAHKTMSAKGGLKVRNVKAVVSEVFEVTGFSDILTIE